MQTAAAIGAMIAGLALLRGIVEPAVKQYTKDMHGNKKADK